MDNVNLKLTPVESVHDLSYLDLLYCIKIMPAGEIPEIWMVQSIYHEMPEGRMEIHSFTIIIQNIKTKKLWTLHFKEIQKMFDDEILKMITL